MSGDLFYRRLRSVIDRAQAEALRLRTPYVGTEHVLLALLDDTSDVPAAILVTFGARPEIVRATLERSLQPGELGDPIPPSFPYTTGAKRAFDVTLREARQIRSPRLASAVMLLALLHDDRTGAFKVLSDAGITLAGTREAIRRLDFPNGS